MQEAQEQNASIQSLVDKLVRIAQENDNRNNHDDDSVWHEAATTMMRRTLRVMAVADVSPSLIDEMAVVLRRRVQYKYQVLRQQCVPQQSGGNDAAAMKRYQVTTMARGVALGSFVSVRSYTQFCLGPLNKNAEDDAYTLDGKSIDIFTTPFSSGQGHEEDASFLFIRQLTRVLQNELGQVADIAAGEEADLHCIVQHDKKPVVAAIVVCDSQEFSAFRLQAAAAATNVMHTSHLPCIAIQMRGGNDDNDLQIRAYGIVCNYRSIMSASTISGSNHHQQPQPPTHACSLLLDATGRTTGLAQLCAGLRSYLADFVHERPAAWHQGYFSKTTALQKAAAGTVDVVYKAYDYRLRSTPANDRRLANFGLVQEFMDAHAKMYDIAPDLQVVATHFVPRRDGQAWYGSTQVSNLHRIVAALHQLHEQYGYVHGDVRLKNMILHHGGMLTDFDLARRQGSPYASTLVDITGDGQRHADVSQAIRQGCIQNLAMEFAHDVYSLRFVLQLFTPVDASLRQDWITACLQEDLPSLMQALANLSDAIVTLIQQEDTDNSFSWRGDV